MKLLKSRIVFRLLSKEAVILAMCQEHYTHLRYTTITNGSKKTNSAEVL